MNNESVKKALDEVLKEKGSKKFSQTVDLIINLKDLDLKKNDQQIDFFVELPKGKSKENKICGLVGPELVDEAKANLDHVIEAHDFDDLKKDPKKIKKLAESYDFFIAQANIMPQVATAFGKILGSRGKMPNPKAGCVVPPKAQLAPLVERLKRTVRVTAKASPSVKVPVGTEDQATEDLFANIQSVYNGIASNAIQGENNIKETMIKLTMGKPVKVD